MKQTIKLREGIPDPGTVVQQAFTGTTATAVLPTESSRIRLGATEDCYYKLGASTVTVTTANGVWLPAGVETIAVGNYTHIAVIRSSASGTLHIARLD